MARVNIIGAGIFGITTAVELLQRGWEVHLFDPGPIPHRDAASTDISKVLRMDYGADRFYQDLMEAAFRGWDSWNEAWGQPLYHECGVLMLSREPMRPGSYVHDSYTNLLAAGYPLDRVGPDELRLRFPAWQAEHYADGYFNPRGGWAESGAVVARWVAEFQRRGGAVHAGVRFAGWLETNGRVSGFTSAAGDRYLGDELILAAGSWTPALHPDLAGLMWPTAQDVLHFRVPRLDLYQPPLFPVYTADVAEYGWYGFPALSDGTLKVAHHGAGRSLDPAGARIVEGGSEERFRAFFRHTFPGLAEAPKIYERVCFYADTFDGDFWIGRDPVRSGLSVASGGSGHGFKFAPVLGAIMADALEAKPNPAAARFAWRELGARKTEFARFEGE